MVMKTYLVGGAVRDKLMGREPKDHDYVVVGATPADMLALGYEQVGADFPVFLHPATREEYALARTERKTGAGYHGFDVEFDTSVTLEQDLERRDLTINSMAMDIITGAVIDPFGGQQDLKSKTLRHTSEAFAEDPLRVIRLARFAGRFVGFTIDDRTLLLCERIVRNGELNELPWERLAAEVNKALDTCTSIGAGSFFDVLDFLDATRHVTFFKYANLKWLRALAKICVDLNDDSRTIVFAALSKLPQRERVHLGGAEAMELGHLIDSLRVFTERTPEAVHDFLKRAAAWQEGGRFKRLRLCMSVGSIVGDWYGLSDQELKLAQALTAPVSAQLGAILAVEGRDGRGIGQAIKARRIELLSSIFPT